MMRRAEDRNAVGGMYTHFSMDLVALWLYHSSRALQM